jgi:hypothetical protein
MGKYNNIAPDFKVSIPYIPEDEKESDPSDGKSTSVKLLLDTKCKAIDKPTIQAQPIFIGGTMEENFKSFQILNSLAEGQSVGEHFRLALRALRRTDKALW